VRAFRTVNRLIVELEAVHWSRFEERRALPSAAQDIIFVPQTTDFALGRVTLLNKVITVVKKYDLGDFRVGDKDRESKEIDAISYDQGVGYSDSGQTMALSDPEDLRED
jgi:hypothetical protein